MLLCEPNVSEGRDPSLIESFAETVRTTDGARLIHCSADADHNRMVLAYRGPAPAVLEATRRLAAEVFERLDLREHEGQHPRVGVLDVVPFVASDPGSESHESALATCRAFGDWAGSMGVPVLYYEDAASAPGRRALPAARRGGFEGLAEKLTRPEWAPDRGPAVPHPTAGAVITGVRGPLVRFNVNLRDPDPTVARGIAREIRESSGGLPALRALGLTLTRRGMSQVTMNLTDFRKTSLATAHQAVIDRAGAAGADVVGVEVIGPVPAAALDGCSDAILEVLEPDQVLDEI